MIAGRSRLGHLNFLIGPICQTDHVMFERYTEKARRVIFFARYEASEYGSAYIESEHLLLGLARENKELIRTALPNLDSPGKTIRAEIEARIGRRPRISTSVEMPLTQECKHILDFAAEEAERLAQKYVGTDHLLLGILREGTCAAARILTHHGASADELRHKIAEHPSDHIAGGASSNIRYQSPYARSQVPLGEAVDSFLKAWGAGDAKAVADLFAGHGQLWDIHGELWHFRAQIENGVAAHFNSAKSTDVAPDVRDIKMAAANVAVVTLVWAPKGEAEQPNAASLRIVLVLREDTHWRIVSAHFASLPPGASTTAS